MKCGKYGEEYPTWIIRYIPDSQVFLRNCTSGIIKQKKEKQQKTG